MYQVLLFTLLVMIGCGAEPTNSKVQSVTKPGAHKHHNVDMLGGPGSGSAFRGSKVPKSKTTKSIDGKFTKTTEVRPGKGPGQSRAEYVRYKNKNGKTIRTHKDSYDRSGNFQHRKHLRGGPEGRAQK